MTAPTILPPGANGPLDGQRVTVTLTAADMGGALFAVEDAAGLRALSRADPLAPLDVTATGARATVVLAALPPAVTRVRLLAWSSAKTRLLVPVEATVEVDGAPAFAIRVGDGRQHLRSAEVLELYRRHGAWKVRAVASGWEQHLAVMAQAVGLPEAAFTAPTAAPPTSSGRRHGSGGVTPSPPVGPVPLRPIVDGIVGPGPRTGDAEHLGFQVAGVDVGLALAVQDGRMRLAALLPLGRGPLSDATAEAALRATGEAPLARVSLARDGDALASAIVEADLAQLDSSLAKALLAEAWVIARAFARRTGPIGWRAPRRLTDDLPRELRLGVAEELQDPRVWADVRERLVLNDTLPLVDEPAAVLAVQEEGQLTIGPTLVAATARAWAIVVERVVRADVAPRAGLWREVAALNDPLGPVRFGIVDEPGPGGGAVILANYVALQVPRTQVLADLQRGLELVDAVRVGLEDRMRTLAPAATAHRKDLPWPPGRRWTGPGAELRDHPVARELLTLPEGAPPPPGLLDRARAQQQALGRAGLGYLAHLALLRAEARDASAQAWLAPAGRLARMAPPSGAGEPCATASIHVRLDRLEHRAAPRPATPPPAPSAPPPGPGQPPRRRWRIFG